MRTRRRPPRGAGAGTGAGRDADIFRVAVAQRRRGVAARAETVKLLTVTAMEGAAVHENTTCRHWTRQLPPSRDTRMRTPHMHTRRMCVEQLKHSWPGGWGDSKSRWYFKQSVASPTGGPHCLVHRIRSAFRCCEAGPLPPLRPQTAPCWRDSAAKAGLLRLCAAASQTCHDRFGCRSDKRKSQSSFTPAARQPGEYSLRVGTRRRIARLEHLLI